MMSDEFYKRGNQKQRLVINKANKRIFEFDEMDDLDAIIDTVGVQLLGVIPEDSAIPLATGKGAPLSSSSMGFLAFSAISRRIKGEHIPLLHQGLSTLSAVCVRISAHSAAVLYHETYLFINILIYKWGVSIEILHLFAHDTKKGTHGTVLYRLLRCTQQAQSFVPQVLREKIVAEATGLNVQRYLSGSQGGDQQIAARIILQRDRPASVFSEILSQ